MRTRIGILFILVTFAMASVAVLVTVKTFTNNGFLDTKLSMSYIQKILLPWQQTAPLPIPKSEFVSTFSATM